MRFQHVEYLWLLCIIPLLIVIYSLYLGWRKRGIRKLGNYSLIHHQLFGHINGRQTTKFVLLCLAVVCAIIGFANLRKGAKADTAERKGVDVIFALDVSKSMLAKDVDPDRLTRAKQLIERLIDKMKNDRVGLVLFAGRAYLQAPLTSDYNSAKMLLSTSDPDVVPTQGTVLAQAIDLANESFSSKEKKYKTLILISDGEDHDEDAVKAAQNAAENGVIIHTIGIGSPNGATIIDPSTGKEKTDEKGNVVITKLNEKELQNIAQAGNGSYQLLNNTTAVANNLDEAISGMEKHNMGVVSYTEYYNYFQYFIAAALLLLIIEWMLPASTHIHKNLAFKND